MLIPKLSNVIPQNVTVDLPTLSERTSFHVFNGNWEKMEHTKGVWYTHCVTQTLEQLREIVTTKHFLKYGLPGLNSENKKCFKIILDFGSKISSAIFGGSGNDPYVSCQIGSGFVSYFCFLC